MCEVAIMGSAARCQNPFCHGVAGEIPLFCYCGVNNRQVWAAPRIFTRNLRHHKPKYMKVKLLVVLLFVTTAVAAQFRKIPVEVTEAMRTRYPHAEKVEWKDKISYFQASFVLNGFKMVAEFSGKGEWERTEREITINDLPGEVRVGFNKSKYAEWPVASVAEIDVNNEGMRYRLFVKKSATSKKYLFFDTNGRLIKENATL